MKKLIIAGIAIVIVVVVYFFLKKKKSASATSTMAPGPGVVLKPGVTAPSGTDEEKVIAHMVYMNTNETARVSTTRVSLGFASQNQALAYLAITDGKTKYKDVSSSYAGKTISEVAAWVKKYVQ
jgi:hypothetical protein